jgi:UDP-N-acetylglucosamine diphosphorylase / glucose-1-phosphate thymidylyltransferase / UDP-N-acetylgalactosamine diphosphorylase / glucosamine-1-phosphate N-acetyltransferase / galactosamine-1-phosphate N-acetyltransferase
MIKIDDYIKEFYRVIPIDKTKQPWEIINELENIISEQISKLNSDYQIENNIAIHKTAVVEQGVVLKGAIIISENCTIGANSYFRGPIFLGRSVKIGPSTEIKQSIILNNSAVAHFNYIGNSIVGQNTNFEAGSICANHYNERYNKTIYVNYNGQSIDTKTEKFGSLIGDNSKVGANAVLSPGTILQMNTIVKRLELIEQTKPKG